MRIDVTIEIPKDQRRYRVDHHTGRSRLDRAGADSAAQPGLVRLSRITVGQRLHRIVQQPTTQRVPQPQPLDHPVRGPSGNRRLQTRAQPPTPAFGPGLPNAGRVRCGMQAYPHPGGLRDLPKPKHNNPTLRPGGLSNGDSPFPLSRHRGAGRADSHHNPMEPFAGDASQRPAPTEGGDAGAAFPPDWPPRRGR